MFLVISPKIVTNQQLHQVFSVSEKYFADNYVLAGKVI